MSGSIFPTNPLLAQAPQGSIYGMTPIPSLPQPVPQAPPPGYATPQQMNPLMAGAMPPAQQQQVPLPTQQPGSPTDPMTQYMQWLLAPQGQQQQPAQGAMTPMGVPLPVYAPTPPGMAPTGPVATGNPNDPFGISTWALQQAIGAQSGGWGGGGYGQGAGGGPVGGAAGNQASAGVGTADVGGVGRGF
jgi:hypothetical protein